MSKLVLAEKPSVAQSIAKVLGANKRSDGYLEGTKAQTEENISDMQKELTSAEKELFLLAADVLEKLSSLTEEEFQKLDLFSDFPM